MLSNIYLFWRVSRKGICSGKVGNIESVTFVIKMSQFGIDCNATVVSHSLFTSRQYIEQRCFSAVGISNQGNVNYIVLCRCLDFAAAASKGTTVTAAGVAVRYKYSLTAAFKLLPLIVRSYYINHLSLTAS